MQSFKSYLLVLLFLPSLLFAKDNLDVGLGAFFKTQSALRGAQYWHQPSFMAGPSFTFFKTISVRGPSVGYSHFPRESQFEWDIRAQMIDDDEPLITFGDHEEDYRNQRSSTWELQTSFKYKFGPRNKFYLGFTLAKDIDETEALYSEINAGVPVYIYTSLDYRISFAERAANQYAYGPEAAKGLGWQEFSIKYVMPGQRLFVPWNGIVINKLAYSKILQNENKNAGYVRGADSHLIFSSFIVWNVY